MTTINLFEMKIEKPFAKLPEGNYEFALTEAKQTIVKAEFQGTKYEYTVVEFNGNLADQDGRNRKATVKTIYGMRYLDKNNEIALLDTFSTELAYLGQQLNVFEAGTSMNGQDILNAALQPDNGLEVNCSYNDKGYRNLSFKLPVVAAPVDPTVY